MNKKKIGALLVGATLLVGAMGSFAYFTSHTSIGGNGENGAFQQLEITNGRVVIKSEVANVGQGLSDWTYDVAKLSTTEDDGDVVAFENKHRSPDISVADETNGKEGVEVEIDGEKYLVSRAKIGAALKTEIQYTRPGDAIVLGTAQSGESQVGGLEITNDSNLTIRVRLKVKDSEAAEAQLQAMQDAGWVLYIKGESVSFDNLKDGINLGIIPAGGAINSVDVRFELPLDRNNNYQDLTAAGGNNGALNLNDLIEIQATQENNHDWEQIDQNNYFRPDQSESVN